MSQQNWPDELDALRAAPRHHVLLLENDAVRVLETRIAAGETTRLHTHRWPCAVYYVSWSDIVVRDGNASVVRDTRTIADSNPQGRAMWSGPIPPHTVENVGPSLLHAITVEVKGPQ